MKDIILRTLESPYLLLLFAVGLLLLFAPLLSMLGVRKFNLNIFTLDFSSKKRQCAFSLIGFLLLIFSIWLVQPEESLPENTTSLEIKIENQLELLLGQLAKSELNEKNLRDSISHFFQNENIEVFLEKDGVSISQGNISNYLAKLNLSHYISPQIIHIEFDQKQKIKYLKIR